MGQVGLADTATQRSPRPPLMPRSTALPAPGELALHVGAGANPGMNPNPAFSNPYFSRSLPAAGAAPGDPPQAAPSPALMSAFASASQIMDPAGSTPPTTLPADFGPADRVPSVSGPLASFPDLASMLGPGTDMFAPDLNLNPRSNLGYDVLGGWTAPAADSAPKLAPPATWPSSADAGALGGAQGQQGLQGQQGYQQGLNAQLNQQAPQGYQQGPQDGLAQQGGP